MSNPWFLQDMPEALNRKICASLRHAAAAKAREEREAFREQSLCISKSSGTSAMMVRAHYWHKTNRKLKTVSFQLFYKFKMSSPRAKSVVWLYTTNYLILPQKLPLHTVLYEMKTINSLQKHKHWSAMFPWKCQRNKN